MPVRARAPGRRSFGFAISATALGGYRAQGRSAESAVRITDGLVGFRGHTQFVLWTDPEVRGLTWLQSTSAPELAFGLVPPPASAADYKVDLRPGDRASLELEDERDLQVYVILNRGEGGGLTVNLQGPVVINKRRRIGRQIRHVARHRDAVPADFARWLDGLRDLRARARVLE